MKIEIDVKMAANLYNRIDSLCTGDMCEDCVEKFGPCILSLLTESIENSEGYSVKGRSVAGMKELKRVSGTAKAGGGVSAAVVVDEYGAERLLEEIKQAIDRVRI